ncbi:MAG: carboxypeptidase regulatory-like domain-containing protein [Fibrobacter sp.]|nr:carboxypeptidase regulatory-like domain-containing protein [Fibrobacter sp.]
MNIFLRRSWLACLIVFASFLTSCSNNDTANGTGSNAGETELASISFVTESGQPLSRAVARTWSLSEQGTEIVQTDTLDINGSMNINPDLNGLLLVEARYGDSLSAMGWINFGLSKPKYPLVASASKSLRGTIQQRGTAVAGATVQILDKEAKTDDHGAFEIQGLPSGNHFVTVKTKKGQRVFQMETDSNSINDLDTPPFILIDDFKDWNSKRTILGRTFGEGWWYICLDSASSEMRQSKNDSSDIGSVVIDSEKGHALHLVFDLDETHNGKFGLAGFSLGADFEKRETFAFFDISSMTAISFDVKGEGVLYLQVVSRSEDGNGKFTYSKPIELSEQWETHSITPEDLESNLTMINAINFVMEEDGEFYLDNIKLEGINPGIWPSLGRNPEH